MEKHYVTPIEFKYVRISEILICWEFLYVRILDILMYQNFENPIHHSFQNSSVRISKMLICQKFWYVEISFGNFNTSKIPVFWIFQSATLSGHLKFKYAGNSDVRNSIILEFPNFWYVRIPEIQV